MKILRLLFLLFILTGFSPVVSAQADCLFSMRFYVRDGNGKTPEKFKIKLSGFELVYRNQMNAYAASRLLGAGEKRFAVLTVEAKGFEKFEKQVEIECGFPSYEIKLKAKGTNEQALFEHLAYIRGKVVDVKQEVISGIKVVLTDAQGKRFETTSTENGYFYLDLPSGIYSIEFTGKSDLAAKKYENFQLKKGFNKLDVTLEVKP